MVRVVRGVPEIDPSTVIDGIVLKGPNNCDYISKNKKWVMFKKATYINVSTYQETDNIVCLILNEYTNNEKVTLTDGCNNMNDNDGDYNDYDDCMMNNIDRDDQNITQIIKKRGRPRTKIIKENKKGRPPTLYNVFVSEYMNILKVEYPDMSNNDRMKECARKWKEQKIKSISRRS